MLPIRAGQSGKSIRTSVAGTVSHAPIAVSPIGGDDIRAETLYNSQWSGKQCHYHQRQNPACKIDRGQHFRLWKGGFPFPDAKRQGHWQKQPSPRNERRPRYCYGVKRLPKTVFRKIKLFKTVCMTIHHAPGAAKIALYFVFQSGMSFINSSRKKIRNEPLVNLRQGFKIGNRYAFIDHVHGLANKTEFNHRAIVLDETGI